MGTPRSINCTVNGKVSKVVKIGGVKRFEGRGPMTKVVQTTNYGRDPKRSMQWKALLTFCIE